MRDIACCRPVEPGRPAVALRLVSGFDRPDIDIEAAIDRTALAEVISAGMYVPNAQAISPASPYYMTEFAPPARDLAKAKKLVAQAGVRPGQTVLVPLRGEADPHLPDLPAPKVATAEQMDLLDRYIANGQYIQAEQHAKAIGVDLQSYVLGPKGRVLQKIGSRPATAGPK